VSLNGVSYDIPGGGVTLYIFNGTTKMFNRSHTVVISGSHLLIDGAGYGEAPASGQLRLTAGGRVFVNGVERRPGRGRAADTGAA
jgi:hypothetical protein